MGRSVLPRLWVSRHARKRLRHRFTHEPVPNLRISPPALPEGWRYPLGKVRGGGKLAMTATSVLLIRGGGVITVVPAPEGILASVLVRMLFGFWVIDESDGFSRESYFTPDDHHNRKQRRIRLERQKK